MALLALLALGFGACVKPRKSPNLPRIFAHAKESRGKTPVIIIPGILGSQLVNPTSGQVVWPSADRSKPDDLDLPISPDLSANQDALMATRVVDATKLSILLPEVRVYRDLLTTLESSAGYKRGSIDAPPADGASDTYYIFYYDWRRDNVENARLLARKIDGIKTALERPDLKFNIVAHSMGGLIARYYAMYGDSDLPAAGDPAPKWAGGASISRLILIGTPNRGAMDALRSLVEGYNYYGGDVRRRGLFNKLDAELIFSLPSIYQLLPFSGAEVRVTPGLAIEPVDLYSLKTWADNQWSIYAKRHRQRMDDTFGKDAGKRLREEEAFLAAVLDRARRFHDALEREPSTPRPFKLFLFGGDCEPTLRAPLIYNDGGKPRTLFRTQRIQIDRIPVDRKKLFELMFAPGDGRVTRSSLVAERDGRPGALFPSDLGIDYAVFNCELHGDLPNNDVLQDNILSILVTDTTAEVGAGDQEPGAGSKDR